MSEDALAAYAAAVAAVAEDIRANGHPYYNRRGDRISLLEWADLYGDWGYRCLADTHVGSRRVVTVWDGTASSVGFLWPSMPLIFSTAYVDERGDYEIWELPSEASALAWHWRKVSHERGRFALTTGGAGNA